MLFLDIETRSRQDLRKVGVYRYTECPDFQILMAAWAHDDEPVQVATTPLQIISIPGLLDPKVEKCAHNAQFERVSFSRMMRDQLELEAGEYLPPEEWLDTMALAAEYGRPTGLDAVARALRVQTKDGAGKNLINLFCKPNRKGEFNNPTDYLDEWLQFIAYCAQDVEVLRDVHRALGPWPTPMERLVWNADQRINDNGIYLDLEMALAAQQASEENRELLEHEARGITSLANPNSIQQVGRWLRERGYPLPDLQRATIETALSGTLPDDVRRVLEIRQDLALAAASKYTAALDTVSSGNRVRGGFWFHGAHTGRWAGRGVQLQNLPRESFKTDEESEQGAARLELGLPVDQPTLKKLVRSMFKGPFTVVDYSAIEARVVAWLAGEEWALQAFRDGRDIYVETAERMGGLTRPQGKIAVLALGYNGAVNSLRAMGAEGDDEELVRLVRQWRQANRKIVNLWQTMGDAFDEGGKVGAHLRISAHGSTRTMHLPSGRALHYHAVKWEKYRTERGVKESWRYADPKSKGRIPTYGGRLVENATQAVARDLLAEALVRLHERGYTVAGHVHDEIIVEGEHPVDEIAKIMSEVPDWAAGLPVDGEGYVCSRYRKG